MRYLFVYPNDYLNVGIPPGVALLVAVLRAEGHEVEVFDFTFIKTKPTPKAERAETGIFLPTAVTLEDLVRDDPVQNVEELFRARLAAFGPDVICLSSMTGLYDQAVRLFENCADAIHCPVIAGGVHATIAPEDAMRPECIDAICVGEGETFLLELGERLRTGRDWHDLNNLGYMAPSGPVINEFNQFVDLDELPVPDWSVFDERHMFRPYMGEVYRGGFILMSRGCPYRCTYCVNAPLRRRLKGCGKYFRAETAQSTIRQIATLKERHGATWFKFGDDTIMTLSEAHLEELADGLEPLGIMFGCSVRPETTSVRKVELLKRMGCVATTIGVESGDQALRRSVLNRTMSDDDIIKAVRILKDHGIRVSTFNMIGLPTETREQVFKTIGLNRRLDADSANVFILYPYPGTEIAMNAGLPFRDGRGEVIPVSKASSFDLSNMTPTEVEGLHKTFNLYMSLPEDLWPVVGLAETQDAQGAMVHESLTSYVRNNVIGRGH